ncbi:MAG: Aminodeoxychorismate synthase component 1 [Candidatus Methanoperedenaceae archaeon GB37]|nr:MAG: Aminodeoxychorismate synthase component 1 [Candidatus Methanoperedenaceae archaeon GB37]CAD7778382.1 Aminodeoxychorismate synthase component 1 [Candidatus Methanoperedenaceae archaeon GB37]
MEIIYNLEFQSRGVYTGIIGYAWQREMVFNVAIRTLEMVEQKVVMGSGGGIVVDSEPEAEYAESLLKTKATMEALRIL